MAKEEQGSTVLAFPKKEGRKPSSTEVIWGKDIVRHGYTAVPNILLQAQHRLGISATQLNIIVQLLEYWQRPDTIHSPPSRSSLIGWDAVQKPSRRMFASLKAPA